MRISKQIHFLKSIRVKNYIFKAIIYCQQKNKQPMQKQMQIRPEIIDQLNVQYHTHSFSSPSSLNTIINCAQQALRNNMDVVNYELNAYSIIKYAIKVKYCQIDPFTPDQRQNLSQFVTIINDFLKDFQQQSSVVTKHLATLNDFVKEKGLSLQLSPQFHKFMLFFKRINIKEAILFQLLSKCQVFYTIHRQRRKSGKQFHLDPLINFYNNTKNKLGLTHSFHDSVLPRRQLRFFQKKNTDKKMKNTLFEAVSNRKYQQVKAMISRGASLQQSGIVERMKKQMYCSHRACQLGDLQMCKILHGFKINWQAKDKQGMTSLHYAVQYGNITLVKYLVQIANVSIQAKDIQNRTPFYFACTQGDLPIIDYLLGKGADVNNQSRLGRSAISKACYLGLVDVVTYLMKCPGINITVADGKGRTALHNAVFGPKGGREGHKFGTNQKDSPQCTQLLLQNGFNVDFQDLQQNTPLHVCMSSDGIDSLRVLLAFGASLTALNCYQQTPLMTGAKFGHLQAVRVLHDEYGASLTIKDVFGKNLMLLCAKFKQDDGKTINRVFYYATDELLGMALQGVKLQKGKNLIENWQQQIDFTFSQLLKERERVGQEFYYFCNKLRQLNLTIKNISLQHLKLLLDFMKDAQKEQKRQQLLQLAKYILANRPSQSKLVLNRKEFQELTRYLLTSTSAMPLYFISANIFLLQGYLQIQSQQDLSLLQQINRIVFELMQQIRQKTLTYCLLKLNINWLNQIQSKSNQNILHMLVRHKKIGTMIQILKVLSGVKMDFIKNKYLLQLLQEQEIHNSKTVQQGKSFSSPLEIVLSSLLIHKNTQGLDPYHLALLLKDASAAKLLQQKMSSQSCLKSQFQVRDYHIVLQDNLEQLQRFNMGYEVQEQLNTLLREVQLIQNKERLAQNFAILQKNAHFLSKQVNIDDFRSVWKNISDRKLIFISSRQDLEVFADLKETRVLGIDIEYFYAQGATLISIMQLSTLTQDYIIDFLTPAKSQQEYPSFIQKVKMFLRPIAYDPKIMKFMHGSDNDLCVIKSILNFSFVNFIDTARVDIQLRKKQNIRGLATLVQQYLGQFMNKDYQVSQWRIRPIPPTMLQYARRDSLVLPFLARKMMIDLQLGAIKEMIGVGCRQAKKNRKQSQPLVKSIKIVQ